MTISSGNQADSQSGRQITVTGIAAATLGEEVNARAKGGAMEIECSLKSDGTLTITATY